MKKNKDRANKKKRSLFDKSIDKFIDLSPDFLTGKKKIYEQKFIKAYGNADYSKEILSEKRKIAKLYVMIIFFILIFIIASFVNNKNLEVPNKIKRDGINGNEKNIHLKITAEEKNKKVEKEVDITVQKKQLTEEGKILRINKTYDGLDKKILGSNKSLSNINSNLNLIAEDKSTGVKILWEIGGENDKVNDGVMNDKGQINSIYAKGNMKINLKAKLTLEDLYKEKEIEIMLGNKIKENENDLENLIEEESRQLSEESSGDYLILPKKILDSIRFTYSSTESFPLMQILIFFIIMFSIIYIKRFSRLEKKIKEDREEMLYEFPLFVEKLLLLLNAGVIMPYAIERISNEYQSAREKTGKKVLYEEILKINRGIKNTNISFKTLLNDMAKRSMSREIMRFSMVVSSNIEKGSEITEKLKQEIDLLFELRKKNAKRKGELAETKLIIPMTMLLIVILIITIAPIAMTM